MTTTIIAAKGKNHEIGKDNGLLWHLPDDFKFFKQSTLNHYVIMGRKTFESLPGLLTKRTCVVVTRQKDYPVPEGHYSAGSLKEAFDFCQQQSRVFIAGGGKIYKEVLACGMADKMLITEVEGIFEEADTYFPEFDPKEWKAVKKIYHPADEKHTYAFNFVTYLKDSKELKPPALKAGKVVSRTS